ncbi:MAG TPA: Ku protein, partial [Candidatus Dormibacteraeota bacterium]
MPTAVWTGSLSLGLVVVPVRLYPAIHKKNVRFHELDGGGRRVRHVRVSEPEVEYEAVDRMSGPALYLPPEGQRREQTWRSSEEPPPELAFEEIRKGFEVAPGQYVSMTREEVAALAPERSRVIDVQQFVAVADVDPIYFESRYYVVPDREWAAPFRL